MPDDDDLDLEGEAEPDGKGLRKQLEKALSANSKLQAEVLGFRSKDFIAEKGFDLVKPEDLAGAKPEDWEAAASKVQDERRNMQADLLRDAFTRQGFEGDNLEEMVQSMIGARSATSEAAETVNRARSVGGLDSSPIPPVNPEKLSPDQKISYGLQHKSKR